MCFFPTAADVLDFGRAAAIAAALPAIIANRRQHGRVMGAVEEERQAPYTCERLLNEGFHRRTGEEVTLGSRFQPVQCLFFL